MNENVKRCSRIAISSKRLVLSAYLYMVIPIVVFFIGWLKSYLAIGFSAILLFGLYYFIKTRYKEDEYFYIELKSLLIIIFSIIIWVFLSGIGGYFYQRGDWHWRNAIFRDLIDYSWPVIYPETGNAMVYYYVYWMVPALVGKVLGWGAANFALYVWTCIGIFFSMLLICKALKLDTTKNVMIMIYIYIFWSGLNIFGMMFTGIEGYPAGILGGGYGWADFATGYQYTPNNALLEWVFNQTIVPWVAISLFLQDERIDVLAYLGLCVLPSAPFPFVGLFVLFVAWAIPKIICTWRSKEYKTLFKQIFSIPNIASLATIFIVFLMFFKGNTAASGAEGIGGVGWYIAPWDLTERQFIVLILFYVLEFLVYSVLIYKENRKNILFYTCNVFLMICPFIRVGTGRDFCMRASIPALFMLMYMVIKKLCDGHKNVITIRTGILISVIALASWSVYADWAQALAVFNSTKTYPVLADDIITLCNDTAIESANFIVEKPSQTIFFKYLGKEKSGKKVEKDLLVAQNYRKQYALPINSGYYVITPMQNNSMCINTDGVGAFLKNGSEQLMLTSMKGGECTFIFKEYGVALDVPGCVVDADGTIWVWQVLDDSPGQRFNIEQVGEYYMICYQEFALTYDSSENSLKLLEKTGADNQMWVFNQVNK